MKKLIFGALLTFIVSHVAHAGTSSEDPTISSLRGRFQAAGAPSSLNELGLPANFSCVGFSAESGDFSHGEGLPFALKELSDGFASADGGAATFAIQPTGLVSVGKIAIPEHNEYYAVEYLAAALRNEQLRRFAHYVVLRVESDGSLISETLVKRVEDDPSYTIYPGMVDRYFNAGDSGISYPDMKAVSYGVCKPIR